MKKFLTGTAVVLVVLYLAGPWLLTRAGEFLVVDADAIESADAVVVLSTGVDYLPRLMQAAALYRQGLARLVVINGNRKTDVHRRLERQGYVAANHWYDGPVAVLNFLEVERNKIITVSAEDAYDTVSEARMVGQALKDSDEAFGLGHVLAYFSAQVPFGSVPMYFEFIFCDFTQLHIYCVG